MRGHIVVLMIALAAGACGDNSGDDTPRITGAALATDEDSPVSYTVMASDPGGGALALTAGAPAHGTVAVSGLAVTYTPEPNYSGADSFQVTVSNGAAEASARIDVTVRPVNDAPVAAADSLAAVEDTPLVTAAAALLANDTDLDGDALSIVAVGGATNGAVTRDGTGVTFTPAANFTGAASFEYTLSDGTVQATATVAVTVGGENDAPEATDDAVSTTEDTPVAITAATLLANDTDADGQTLSITGVDGATNGTVAFDSGVATFTPAANYSGAASFQYTVTDGAATATATVTIAVGAVDDPVIAVDDAATTPRNTPLALAAAALLANDLDPDGPAPALTSVQNPVNGAATLAGTTVTFTPDAGFTGIASFEYVVTAGAASDIARVVITVTAVLECGDGDVVPPEACDDGGTVAGDGCSATCEVEAGWSCTGEPSACTTICGDDIVAGTETCDDGNTTAGDGCSAVCQREIITVFTFTGGAGNEATASADGTAPPPGLAALPVMSRGTGVSPSAGANTFAATGWTTGATPDANDYFSFTITPAAGATATLLWLELDERRSNTGIRSWAVRSSLDGFAADLGTYAVPDNDQTRANQVVPLGAAFTAITAPVELRIYGYAAEGATGTWRIDNVELVGTTTGP